MQIRIIEPKDDPEVAKLVRDCLTDAHLNQPGTAYFDPQLDQLYEFYSANDQRDYYVIVDDHDKVVAGCGFGEYQPGIAELQKLYVNPNYRGHGAAHELMTKVEQGAKAAGYQQLYLETHHNLQAAITLYTHTGWQSLPAPLHAGPHTTMDYFFIKDL